MFSNIINENHYGLSFLKSFKIDSPKMLIYKDVENQRPGNNLFGGGLMLSKNTFYSTKNEFIKTKNFFIKNEILYRDATQSGANQRLRLEMREKGVDAPVHNDSFFSRRDAFENDSTFVFKNSKKEFLTKLFYFMYRNYKTTYISLRLRKLHFEKYLKSTLHKSVYTPGNKTDNAASTITAGLKPFMLRPAVSTGAGGLLSTLVSTHKASVMSSDLSNREERPMRPDFVSKDPVYGSFLFNGFINGFMRDGKKLKVQKLIYKLFTCSNNDFRRYNIEAFFFVLQKLLLNFTTVMVRIGAKPFAVPIPVRNAKKFSIALKMLIKGIKRRGLKISTVKKADTETVHTQRLKRPLIDNIRQEFHAMMFNKSFSN